VHIVDYAAPDLIAIGLEAADKEHLLQQMVDLLVRTRRVVESQVIMRELLKREHVMSTGIGGGIALPHALSNDIQELALVFARTRTPVEFQALDGNPVDLVFMAVGPKSASNVYVKLLARVSRLLQSEDFKGGLRAAASPEDVLAVFRREE
jgi:mannitol/fructose-specific phosphotransferase system IIA component (Ntr-type)